VKRPSSSKKRPRISRTYALADVLLVRLHEIHARLDTSASDRGGLLGNARLVVCKKIDTCRLVVLLQVCELLDNVTRVSLTLAH
jgi:hypothetical protein